MHDRNLALFKEILTDNGYRLTIARSSLFELLLDSEPLSINQLMAKSNGQIDRVGMYRNVELFETLGIIRRVTVGWKYKLELSDRFIEHHHHLICKKCSRIFDMEADDEIEQTIEKIARRFSFTPTGHQFEVEGYCMACSSK